MTRAAIRAALASGVLHDSGPWAQALDAAKTHAPYLARLIAKHGEQLNFASPDWPQTSLHDALRACADIERTPPAFEDGMEILRIAKQRVHLALAVLDLSCAWDLNRITGALTDFADASVRAALGLTARALTERGDLTSDSAAIGGPAVIAMGKMGAGELNYSSDIDVSLFYEPEALPVAPKREPRTIAQRIAAHLVRALEELTPNGYVFRTDLRLRPDPASTPPAVTLAAAEQYYQSVGQNWERAAFIKARVCAGDVARGEAFLASLKPFVWRRNLDYAAMADVLSIKRQIIAAKARSDLESRAFDVKLGRGGVRDIELLAQTQQLILGGRNGHLRSPRTEDALDALAGMGVIAPAVSEDLREAYRFYRGVEHRIQMQHDAHTHTAPADGAERAHLAALCGFADMASFDAALRARRALVADFDQTFFSRFESLSVKEGALSFTGVEDNPDTLETLSRTGFADPAAVSGAIRGWHHGRIRATRAERARELLTALTPDLLRSIADAGEPDAAFARFNDFFSGLSAGVTLLSLFQAHPDLMRDLASIFAAAPKLAQSLAHRPVLIDAMLEARFATPLSEDARGARAQLVAAAVAGADSFEGALNAVRRVHREESLRIAVQIITHAAAVQDAASAYTDLADACVAHLSDASLREVERIYGPAPGAHAIVALGKFGGRELSEGSDLDLVLVYDAPEGAVTTGARSLGAGEFYAKLTQRLISALSAPTEEGGLYQVDMQLRPSGSKGPVAVRLSSFARYYTEEAWTWELLALTRLRAAAGDRALAHRMEAAAQAALAAPRDWETVRADTTKMRSLMARERPAKSHWDLKLARGGFVDLEFIAQALQLRAAAKGMDAVRAHTGEALARLAALGVLPAQAAEDLAYAWRLYSALQHLLRASLAEGSPAGAPAALRQRLCEAVGAASFSALEDDLRAAQEKCRAWFTALVETPGDGNASPARA